MKQNWLCKRGWHKFRARYNEKPRELERFKTKGFWNPEEIRALLTTKEYVLSICVRCGKVIKQ